jgi:hypothetical protein
MCVLSIRFINEYLDFYNIFRGISHQNPYLVNGLNATDVSVFTIPFKYYKQEVNFVCAGNRIRQYYELRAACNTYYNRKNKYENRLFFCCCWMILSYFVDMEQIRF